LLCTHPFSLLSRHILADAIPDFTNWNIVYRGL
jgi:hypothetical protein